jgi:hypothetical protein
MGSPDAAKRNPGNAQSRNPWIPFHGIQAVWLCRICATDMTWIEKDRMISYRKDNLTEIFMHIPQLQPLVALIAGILILVKPKLLNYIVAFYLILIGVMGLVRF